MPHACHKSFAVTGAVGLATACALEGTIASEVASPVDLSGLLTIEHPSGRLALRLEQAAGANEPVVSVLRTSRRLFEGAVIVPSRSWAQAA